MPAEVPGYCTLCRSRCGILNVVDGSRLLEVKARPGHPTGRATCAKGRAAPELVHSTNRLTSPLRRTNPKGAADPGWREIGWDEALAEVAERLGSFRERFGAESVAFSVTSPSGTSLSDSIDWIERFIRVFGSPNTCYATEICNWHKDFAHAFTFGCGIPNPDYARSDLVLLWGHTPANTWLAQAGEIAEGQIRGAKLIVVDPRRTAHAARADHWLRVWPGSDAALALGLLNLLIAGEGFDQDFVRLWTNAPFLVRTDTGLFLRGSDVGFASAGDYVAVDAEGRLIRCDPAAPPDERLRGAALRGSVEVATPRGRVPCRPAFDLLAEHCATFTPERVEALTTVPADEIRAAADAIRRAQSVSYYSWNGIGQHANATQTDRAVAVLYALTGSFDAPGGNVVLNRQPANRVNDGALLPKPQQAKALGLGKRPLGPPSQGWITARDLYGAILDGDPYRVRGLFGFGANLLLTQSDVVRGAAALERLDFYVHCDLFETPTARYADILLPVSSAWEREGLKIGHEITAEAEELIQLRPQMVPPRGDSKSDLWIVFELAKRLGLGHAFFEGSIEAGWNHMLAPLGLTVAELRESPEGVRRPVPQGCRKYRNVRDGAVQGFATESRRVEIYSERLFRAGYPALPTFDERDAPSSAEGRFPYLLTSAKSGFFCHSQHRSLPSLRRKATEPSITLHPDLARTKGISEGDWAAVQTRAGQGLFRAKLDAALHPDVLVGEFGWWQSCADLGYPGYDPLSPGGSNYNALITSERTDPVSGSVPHRSFPCTIERHGASDPHWEGLRPLVVQALHHETPDVVRVTLAPLDGSRLPDFRPGQHILVRAEAVAGSRPLTRAYSLSSSAVDPRRRSYEISVREVAQPGPAGTIMRGAMSGHVARTLQVGDILGAQRPAGGFTLPTECDFLLVLVAAGIGITPFMSLLETLSGAARPPRVLLLYGNRGSANHAFKARIAELRATIPGLTVMNFYSRPGAGDVRGRDFDHAGRIAADIVAEELIRADARFYLCGPEPMLSDIGAGLTARGVPRFRIFQEIFRSQGEVALPSDRTFKVVFRRSGQEAIWTPDSGTLLDFAEASGVQPGSGCRVGQCESCAVQVLQGQVRYLSLIDYEDRDRCLACQAVPASDLVLDV